MGSGNLRRLSFDALQELIELVEPNDRSLLEEGVDGIKCHTRGVIQLGTLEPRKLVGLLLFDLTG